jgi:hypothetical protein
MLANEEEWKEQEDKLHLQITNLKETIRHTNSELKRMKNTVTESRWKFWVGGLCGVVLMVALLIAVWCVRNGMNINFNDYLKW